MNVTRNAKSISTSSIFLLFITSLFLLFRLLNITEESYWIDELYSATRSNPDKDFLNVYYWGPDPHPPFHYILLWLGYNLFGFNEYLGRFISVLSGTLVIPATYYFAKKIISERVGVISAVLVSINTTILYFSTEVRSYELMALCSLLSTLYFLNYLLSQKKLYLIAYFIFSLMLKNLHFFGALIIISHLFASFLIFRSNLLSKEFLSFIAINLLVQASYIPLLGLIFSVANSGPTWIQEVNFFTYLFNTFTDFVFYEFAYQQMSNIFFGAILLLGLIYGMKELTQVNSSAAIIILTLGLFLLVIPIIIGYFLEPIFNTRNAIGFLPFFLILISLTISKATINLSNKNVYLLGAILIFITYANYEERKKQDWRNILKDAIKESNVIYTPNWLGQWQTYQTWLGLEDIQLLDLNSINKSEELKSEKYIVVWAQVRPEKMQRLSKILPRLRIKDEKDFKGGGIIIYEPLLQ